MGLFKKRATDPAEIENLKAEIETMSARLAASDEAKGQLDSTVRGLVSRLDTPTPPPPDPPPATPAIDPAAIDILNAKIERLSVRIDEPRDGQPPTIDPAEVQELNTKIELLASRIDDSDSAAPVIDPARIDDVNAKMDRISSRIDDMDQRITSIATELANQISEMSGELDSLGGSEPATDEIVDELRDAQTRLAGEQARYQIAFRQDLAELADRLKRA